MAVQGMMRAMTTDEKSVGLISKFLSLVLRHQPDRIGIELDDAGWVGIDVLLGGLRRNGQKASRDLLEHVVRTNDKQRFTIDETRQRIRANQGHSIEVESGYELADPPAVQLHGTAALLQPSGLEEKRQSC